MKNFDTARKLRGSRPAADRTFVIGGQSFVRRVNVPADVMTVLDPLSGGGVAAGEVLRIVDGLIGELVEPPGAGQWGQLRARGADEDPLTLADVMAVIQWLIEEETTVPTSEPSPSGDGSASLAPGAPSTGTAPSVASILPISPSDDFSAQRTPT